MIQINNFLHREQLSEIIQRWFYNSLEPEDMSSLKALVNFNSLWIKRVGDHFSNWLLFEVTQQPIHSAFASNKGTLKKLLVENPWYISFRIQTLIRRFQESPEKYFLETPFSGTIYTITPDESPLFVGSSRIKRIRRIAEKGARKISEALYTQIKEDADFRVYKRAKAIGLSIDEMLSNPQENEYDLERAEKKIMQSFQKGTFFSKQRKFHLHDILGVKLIIEDDFQSSVIEMIGENPNCNIIEIEHHRGRYNATNIIFQYSVNKEEILSAPLSKDVIQKLKSRGMDPAVVQDDFNEFVLSGEESIHIELILCNFSEMLESEIGASMHETRIVQQRQEVKYKGYLAKNIGYLMEYLFACGISPKKEIKEIPIQLWTQYMPDYFDEVLKDLFEIPSFRQLETNGTRGHL